MASSVTSHKNKSNESICPILHSCLIWFFSTIDVQRIAQPLCSTKVHTRKRHCSHGGYPGFLNITDGSFRHVITVRRSMHNVYRCRKGQSPREQKFRAKNHRLIITYPGKSLGKSQLSARQLSVTENTGTQLIRTYT